MDFGSDSRSGSGSGSGSDFLAVSNSAFPKRKKKQFPKPQSDLGTSPLSTKILSITGQVQAKKNKKELTLRQIIEENYTDTIEYTHYQTTKNSFFFL